MKIKYLLATTCLTMLAGAVYAGFVQPFPVVVDLDNGLASGDQLTARTADDDVSFIGCGTRHIDLGMGNSFRFGFCQAADAEDTQITCFTESPNLIDEMRANSSYAFITFSWVDDPVDGPTCTRVGFSTQSFYLPDPNKKPKGK